jgi:hypothetical protein
MALGASGRDSRSGTELAQHGCGRFFGEFRKISKTLTPKHRALHFRGSASHSCRCLGTVDLIALSNAIPGRHALL